MDDHDFLFIFYYLVFLFELRCCGLICGLVVCDAVAVAVLRFKYCGLVSVAVCGSRLWLWLGFNTAFRGMVYPDYSRNLTIRSEFDRDLMSGQSGFC